MMFSEAGGHRITGRYPVMTRRLASMLLTFSVFMAFAVPQLSAQRKEVRKVEDAIEVFRAFAKIPETRAPESMMSGAHGVAIIPGVQKLGLVVGGEYGTGLIVARNDDGSWGSPVFIILKGGSIGLQIGAQTLDLVLSFRTRSSIERVMEKGFTLGVDASVAAGDVGRRAAAGTDADLKAEIYSYSRSQGLFAGVSMAGARIEVDGEANAAYYGKAGIGPEEILKGRGLALPASAIELSRLLAVLPTGR
jgi:lipid-binding SYLF domain-containing protein